MTRITLQNGRLVLRDGKIGTGQACCCGGCSGPCSALNPCGQGCACDTSGSTSATSVCYQNGIPNPEITSQASCEECVPQCEYVECTETFEPDYAPADESGECPEGWLADGWGGCREPCPPGFTDNAGGFGFCSRTTYPASCAECAGSCSTAHCPTIGNCGRWGEYADGQCKNAAPCNACGVYSAGLPTVTVTARFFEGSSCPGRTVSGTLSVGGIGGTFGTWWWQSQIEGIFFYVVLTCEGGAWVTAINFSTNYQCLLGLRDAAATGGGFVGIGSGIHPVASSVVNGVCRLSSGNWTATAQNSGWPGGSFDLDPNFGLELEWSITFQ